MANSRFHSLPYRADIDGLRAIAVLSVLFFHLGSPYVSGGYVGVDIFLVISGYLITSVIVRDLETNTFSFRSFYARRVRRIFPALFAMATACTIVAILFYSPDELRTYAATISSLSIFASNVYFRKHSTWDGYFEASQRPSVLLHTWSLSLEEQFYILFPLLLFVLYRFLKPSRKYVLLGISAVSFCAALLLARHHPIANFYLLPSRAWEFLVGALLAINWLPAIRNRMAREGMVFTGLGMVYLAVTQITSHTRFPGYATLLPVVGAALIIYAGEAGDLFSSVLRFPPLVFVGVISYSLYLWHWPTIVLARYIPCMPQQYPLQGRMRWFCVGLSFALAMLSYFFVERPFRKTSSGYDRRKTLAWGGALACGGWLFAWLLLYSHGLPERYNLRDRQILIDNQARKTEYDGAIQCENSLNNPRKYSDVAFCEFGHSEHNILLWGDSHAGVLVPLLKDLQATNEIHGEGVITGLSVGCPPSQHLNQPGAGYYCDVIARYTMQRAMLPDVDTVLIQFYPWWNGDGSLCAAKDGHCVGYLSMAEIREQFLADLTTNIRTLRAAGKRVILGMPFPSYTVDIPDYEMRRVTAGRFLSLPDPNPERDLWSDTLKALAAREGAEIWDVRAVLCHQRKCMFQVGGVSILRDSDHMAATQVGLFRTSLEASLNRTSP